jgi:DNA-binding beta-propeller fold protein YncE
VNTHNKANRNVSYRAMVLLSAMILITAASRSLRADTGTCSGQMITLPFSDVPSSNIFFCAIGEAYFSGLTNGTTATTYSPSANVPREQMAAFVTRTMDQSVKRSSRRAALDQNWSTVAINDLALTTAGSNPVAVKADGADLWVANKNSGTVSRIRASDGKLLETWTGALGASGVLCAMGKVFVTGDLNPGQVYVIDPTQPAGAVEFLTTLLDATSPQGIAFDGLSIWTANQGGSISKDQPR